jgi:hypothetical protein
MPAGSEGWWLNLVTGKSVAVYEHAAAVMESPKKFGLKPDAVQGFSIFNPKHREKILLMAMAKGWCRVRTSGSMVTFEFDYRDRIEAIFTIISFLKKKGFGEFSQVEIHDIRRPRMSISTRAGELFDPEKLEEAAMINPAELKRAPIKKLFKRYGAKLFRNLRRGMRR